jgi:DnaK suppressor protein
MSLGAKKLNTGSQAGRSQASKLTMTTTKGVLSKAVLSKPAPAKAAPKVIAKATPAKNGTAQKLAVTSRAALVNKPGAAPKANAKSAINSSAVSKVNKPMSTRMMMNSVPVIKPAPAPVDPRFEPFKVLLEAKRDELRHSLGDMRYGAQGQNGRVAEEDQAAVSHEEFISSQRNSMEFRILRLVNAALDRIVRGEYAICHACEEDISEKRLKAIPWAEFCVRCQDAHANADHDASEAATPVGAVPALQVWNW